MDHDLCPGTVGRKDTNFQRLVKDFLLLRKIFSQPVDSDPVTALPLAQRIIYGQVKMVTRLASLWNLVSLVVTN